MQTATLSGKVALVTGGSRGIGAAIVKRLASVGAAVAFTYASAVQKAEELVKEVEAAGGKALALRADSSDPDSVKGAVSDTVKAFGGINILVNNAGLLEVKPYDQFTIEEFDHLMAVNVRAIFAAVQAAAPQMGEGDRILTIGSINGDISAFPGMSLYSMAKAAVAGLTRGLARDLAPLGITVNNLQPGPIDTDMNPADGSMAPMLKGLISLGRYGKATEVAGLVSYLASPEAAYITGASINIDGGFMI
ncbi:SDR family oxidoreductase [Paenibacillus sp. LMG 31460]|uniref:SDR family oxidoreductase n=1 Tax=Paenibacillus germinis TaxID=2654979 RepID=A0ABX1Z3R5_9BACL|nr:3-oxoacyl-ACP reductase family protein [Paenibacillus germinis]NOU87479.1 SDR family oxidoreductase [Paenibacillus germinis]